MPDRLLSRLGLPRSVWLLGWVSFFTDTATEMIYPLLPIFVTRVLGGTAFSLGLIEGAAETANSALKIVSGRLSDRWRVRRPIVIAGYTVSSSVRPLIALATSWPHVLVLRLADRVGKGIRGAPRDALLAELAPTGRRGFVYGFHRAMDHTGAVAGPLIAALFLWFAPGEYRTLFALALVPGALAVLLLFGVRDERRAPVNASEQPGEKLRGSRVSVPRGPQAFAWPALPGRFYYYLTVLLIFTLGNSADVFLLLRLNEAGVMDAWIPLLWAALHVVKATSSFVGGGLSDRWGRRTLIAGAWMIYAAVYAGFAMVNGPGALIAIFLAYGVYFGLSEGAERALVVDMAPAALRGTAFGLYHAAMGVAAFAASALFGLLWEGWGHAVAFGFGGALALTAALVLLLLPRSDNE